MYEGVNAGDFGAVGDGRHDDSAALQAALDAAADRGGLCYVPPGRYRLEGSLMVPAGVAFVGASHGVPHSEHPIGTVLLAYGGRGDAEASPLITLKPNARIQGMTIHYPEQTVPDVVPYPWSIRVDGELCQITDMVLTNPYQALDLGTCWNELHLVRNVFACPLHIGVYVDQCTDIGRLENVHFNPNFWTRMQLQPGHPATTGALKAYLEENLIGFKIGKTDWEYVSNCFVIFPRIGFHFDDFGHGPGNAVLTQSGSDICPVAVRVDRVQSHAGIQFVNGQFMATVEVGETNIGPVKFTNCGFWGVPETRSHVVMEGQGTLILNACHFTGWDAKEQGAACIEASRGRLVVHGCDFMDPGKLAMRLDGDLTAASIVGNTFRSDRAILNESAAQTQIGFNTTV